MSASDDNSVPAKLPIPLFPSAPSINSDGRRMGKSLFPISTSESSDSRSVPASDWLNNKSFVSNVAEKIHDIFTSEIRESVCLNESNEGGERQETVTISSDEQEIKRKIQDSDKKSVKDKKKKERKKSKRSRKEIEKPVDESLLKNYSKKVFIEDVRISPEHAFYVDRNGDGSNKAFSEMYHHFVARYHQEKKPSLGLAKVEEQQWLKTRKTKKNVKAPRYCNNRSAKIISNYDNEFCGMKDGTKNQFSKDYLPLTVGENFSSSHGEDAKFDFESKIYDKSTLLYIQGKGKEQEDEIDVKVSSFRPLSSEIEYYNKKLRENPNDIKLWLEFVDFQDRALEYEVMASSTKDRRQVKLNNTVLIDKKLAILEKAISSNPSSIELAIHRLRLSENLWESSKVESEWKNLAFIHPNSTLMWQNYLLYMQSNLQAFSATNVSNLYIKCLSVLSKIADGQFKSHKAPENLEISMIGIFSNFASFCHQAGYTERALSLFQAMIELNCCVPDSIKSASHSVHLERFEQFWESGTARIGEEGASGWRNTNFNNYQVPNFPNLDAREDSIMSQSNSEHLHWLEIELLRERESWLPWRPDRHLDQTEEDCEDPECIVQLQDISSSLFQLKSEFSKFILVLQFLSFLGINIEPHSAETCQKLKCHSQERFTSSSCLSLIRHFKFKYSKSDVMPSIADLDDSIWKFSQCETFVSNLINTLIPCFNEPFKTDLKILWCQTKLLSVVQTSRASCTARKSLQKSLRKDFKSFLQQSENRNLHCLWLVFAQFELSIGNYSDSEKVLDFLLSANSDNLSSICRIYRDVFFAMKSHAIDFNEDKYVWNLACCAIGHYTQFTENSVCGSTMILKVKKGFTEYLGEHLIKNESGSLIQRKSIADWLACHAMFVYLVNSMQNAVEVYESAIKEISAKGLERSLLEEVYMDFIALLLHHVNTSSSPLSTIRDVLSKAIETFPDNQHFLRLFIDLEERSFISGRLRRFFGHLVKPNNDVRPLSWCYATFSEFIHLENISCSNDDGSFSSLLPASGSFWWLTSLFEKADQMQSLQHCVYFWRLYMKFEIEQKHWEKAKSIFYRAVQKCPWAKCIYADACKYFPEELQQLHDVMTEKEIRIRAPLDEIKLLRSARS